MNLLRKVMLALLCGVYGSLSYAELNEVVQVKRAIKQKVERSWIRPSDKKGRCTISVEMMPDGSVITATVVARSGDPVFDKSVENAVFRASPLPHPKDKAVFTQNFRSFTVSFEGD